MHPRIHGPPVILRRVSGHEPDIDPYVITRNPMFAPFTSGAGFLKQGARWVRTGVVVFVRPVSPPVTPTGSDIEVGGYSGWQPVISPQGGVGDSKNGWSSHDVDLVRETVRITYASIIASRRGVGIVSADLKRLLLPAG